MKTTHITVTGRVQGVGFRYFTVRCANDLGLCGWVRNLPDGSVETAIQGQGEKIEEMIRRLRQGPVAANVSGLEIEEIESESGSAELSGFAMRF
ncbi:MAG: acylphosphatase [Candidatus Methanogaster sp.]|uniref:Acylphosphatase n=1 Tax=Candidatus Methanogaster sp. TaxID=3386292 RepID=A0AC61KYX5_9EURY|nr:MAG: acylphosphatase [ANME-2 cluster archaeon]